jgi:hypothetical protein
MKKIVLNTVKMLTLIFFLMTMPFISSFAQEEEENKEEKTENKDEEKKNSLADEPFSKRLVFGGDFGFSFGNSSSLINISPLIGYRFTEKFSAGGGFSYLNLRARSLSTNNATVNYQLYGVRVYGRYQITENIFAHAEYEYLNVPYASNTSLIYKELRAWLPMMWLGVGYRMPLGERSAFLVYAAYNVLHANAYYRNDGIAYSPYSSPITVRTGFTF